MHDLRISLRRLRTTPGLTATAVTILALGIGLNAAMFSLVHALVFAARPFPQPDQLVQLYARDTRADSYRGFSYASYEQLASRADLFTGLLSYRTAVVGVGENEAVERTFAALVSADYFDVLGVPLLRGRGFRLEEAAPRRDVAVMVVSHAFWQRTGYDDTLVGQTRRINGRLFTVVGITPPGFTGTQTVLGPELFFPLGVADSLTSSADATVALLPGAAAATDNLLLVARLRADVSLSTANQAFGLFGQSLAVSLPAEYRDQVLSLAALPRFGTGVSPASEAVLTTLGVVVLGMTLAVLLTICLNLTSVMLARGRERRKELAIRLAIGGTRGRVIRQLLTEGLLLSLVGGALGLACGQFGITQLLSAIRGILPVTIVLEGQLSWPLLAATAALCLLATAAFALGPALKHSRADIVSDLKAQRGEETSRSAWKRLPRHPLVAAQVALSLTLLIAAGLFVRMALGAGVSDLGYDADATVLAEVDSHYAGLDQQRSVDEYARIEQRLAALPGVQTASIGAIVPLGLVQVSRDVRRAGDTSQQRPGPRPTWNAISGSYFDTMGVRLLRGRVFTALESFARDAPAVAILDDTLARRLWPAGDALGQRVQWAAADAESASAVQTMEVVGIVAGTRRELFENVPRGAIYVPFAQGFVSHAHFHVRPTAARAALIDDVRREIRETSPALPLFSTRTFAQHLSSSAEYWTLQMTVAMFGAFGGLAMAVALVGIYGVTAYAVTRRTREIGVRVAIGARPAVVVRMLLREGLATLGCGIAIGWLLGLGAGRLMANLFVDLPAFDGWTFGLVPLGFLLAAVMATWLPARRSTRIDPMTALRSD